METKDPRLTGGCGLKAWITAADDVPPDRICVAPYDHVARGIPHKWVRFADLIRADGSTYATEIDLSQVPAHIMERARDLVIRDRTVREETDRDEPRKRFEY